jgi:outer membrane protein OmpA-like peptidoglycan-associated protein
MALAMDLQQCPDMRIEIQARVESLGPEVYNYRLTQARASAVRDLLVVEGVPAERLIARGYGTQPLSVSGTSPVAFVVRR